MRAIKSFKKILAFAAMALFVSNAYSQCMTFTTTDITCNGADDGSITITINNGGPNYNFSIFGSFGQRDVKNHPSNTYTFTNVPPEANILIVTQYTNGGGNYVYCPVDFASISEPDPLI